MKILFHKKFYKDFDKIPRKIQSQFFDRVELFEIDPTHSSLNNQSIDAVYPGWRSINITGDYRALFDPKLHDVVLFMRIGTHAQLYK